MSGAHGSYRPRLWAATKYSASPENFTLGRDNDDSSDDDIVNDRSPLIPPRRSQDNVSPLGTRYLTAAEEADESLPSPSPSGSPPPEEDPPVSWSTMPNKGQLAMIVFARLAEPLTARSLTSYLFYQLKWFDPQLPDSDIVSRAGFLTAAFAAAQCVTAMFWGHAADNPRFGRKKVLLIGLSGTCIAALGMGFSTSYGMALFFRMFQGALNGNIGVLRTMVSEIVEDRRYRARAFLLLPMCFNVGVIIGPLIGGFLADPIVSLPNIFGPGSWIGGKNGVHWMRSFPYALPNLVCATFLVIAAMGVIFGLKETHPLLRNKPDPGRRLGVLIYNKLFRRKGSSDPEYTPVSADDDATIEVSPVLALPTGDDEDVEEQSPSPKPVKEKASLRSLCTSNVIITLLQHHVQSIHVSAFNALLFLMLPASRDTETPVRLPFWFTGGLGLSAKELGFANTIIGCVGIPVQILLFPWLSAKLGLKTSYRAFLPLGMLAYFMLPYIVLLPDRASVLWPALVVVLASQVFSRVFVGPATVLLVNECAPHPTLLGTVHGIGQSVSSAARMIGPTLGGLILGWGLDPKHNMVGGPFWVMAVLAMVNWVLLFWVGDVRMS